MQNLRTWNGELRNPAPRFASGYGGIAVVTSYGWNNERGTANQEQRTELEHELKRENPEV